MKHLLELEALCAAARFPVVLDLSQLVSADDEAMRWLRGRLAGGDPVTGASPYIRLRLERLGEEPSDPRG